ncbi:MAG TPA: peptidase M48 Ste24p [Desulfobulbus sp.]|nr:peptidase M48 Ste24p [Desulfobulbus sp.]
MLYANLLYFLVVIFVFSTNTPAKEPVPGPWTALLSGAFALFLFSRLAAKLYSRSLNGSSRLYFSAEKKLSILAVALFTFFVYGLDLKYYLHPLSMDDHLPVLENLAGLAVFFLLLSVMWVQARPAYQVVFQRKYSSPAFIVTNIKANLPIVLPFLVLSAAFDLLGLLPWPRFHALLISPWGDLLLFAVFVCFLALFFPPLVRWLWSCKPMPQGPLRQRIEAFCRSQGFSSEILYWPLFEGQVLTAGIMGIVPRFRYLLITPALLAALDEQELDSVLAHEIGHVKKMHLVLYIVLFFGFSILAGALAEPLPYLLLGSESFYRVLGLLHTSPDALLAVLTSLPLLAFMLIYFRFIFGYFIRNFERQADLYVFKAQGTSGPLIRSFEKIAVLSGNIRDEKSWHHFGIGERIDFLEKCEQDPGLIRRHDRKLYVSLGVYFLVILCVVLAMQRIDVQSMAAGFETRYAEAVLEQKLQQEPDNSLWLQLLGDLMQKKAMEKKAIEAYDKALALNPMNAELNNNLAWLLLTARDRSVRDPVRALTLARTAAMLKEEGFILDTLATAYWANGLLEEARATEVKAARIDPENRKYYRSQWQKFRTRSWAAEP